MADTENSRRDVWRAVIQQARADAVTRRADPTSRFDRDQARAWFNNAGRDFREVCALAECDPSWVRRESLAYIAADDALADAGLPRAKKRAPTPQKHEGRRYTHDGETLTIREWSERIGIHRNVLDARIVRGWPIERVVTTPVVVGSYGNPTSHRQAKRLTLDGLCLSVDEWAERIGVDAMTLHTRLEAGWTVERTLTTPAPAKLPMAA